MSDTPIPSFDIGALQSLLPLLTKFLQPGEDDDLDDDDREAEAAAMSRALRRAYKRDVVLARRVLVLEARTRRVAEALGVCDCWGEGPCSKCGEGRVPRVVTAQPRRMR